MNAKDLIGPLEQQPDHYLMTDDDETQVILRALRLLAAAEANDGSTPVTDEQLIQGMFVDADLSRRFERERNGLAARVAELEASAATSSADHFQRTGAIETLFLKRSRLTIHS